jgi:tungstate transport system substrate-binding protein
MGDTLRFANETGAYTLSDRGTFLALKKNLPELVPMIGGGTISENQDPSLLNPYSVIPVNPNKGNIEEKLALDFATWLTDAKTQALIAEFGIEAFGQPLFYPDSAAWKNR